MLFGSLYVNDRVALFISMLFIPMHVNIDARQLMWIDMLSSSLHVNRDALKFSPSHSLHVKIYALQLSVCE